MSNFHHNIFYYYRGQKKIDSEFERQLEDNTTKALINTLEHCSPIVIQKFLDWLDISSQGKTYNFILQKKTIGEFNIKGKPQKLLLGLVPNYNDKQSTCKGISSQRDSRPDAWIYGDDYVILIESKVVGNLNTEQMEHHLSKLNIDDSQEVRKEVRKWADIHSFFNSILAELGDKNKWLVKQFTQYLEWNSMAKFTGFKPDIFDYFIAHDNDVIRKWVRNTMKEFAETIQLKLYKMDHFYSGYDLGRLELKQNATWIAFGPIDKKYRKYAHLTLVLNASGIEVILNIELKPAIDRLKQKMHNENDKFRKYLSSIQMDSPLWIQIEERIHKQVMLYDYNLVAKIELSSLRNPDINLSGFAYLESIIDRLQYPYFSIRKLINRDQVCKISQKDQGKSLVNEILMMYKNYHSFVSFIN